MKRSDTTTKGLSTGTVLFERLRILNPLGSGTSGTVFACIDTYLGNLKVALKLFPHEILSDSVASTRLNREIMSLHALNHENVVKLYDCFRDDNFIGLSMEYVAGQTLRSYIDKNAPLEIGTAMNIVRQVASGVKALHSLGIIHRDLKPSNVLITPEGRVKITDLGLARDVAGAVSEGGGAGGFLGRFSISTVTHAGVAVGTPDYVSPEYVREGKVDQRADIYAIGVIGYEMLTGKLPYQAETIVDLLRAKVETDPVPIREQREDMPIYFESVLQCAMERNLERRYQDLKDMLTELGEAERSWRSETGARLSSSGEMGALSSGSYSSSGAEQELGEHPGGRAAEKVRRAVSWFFERWHYLVLAAVAYWLYLIGIPQYVLWVILHTLS